MNKQERMKMLQKQADKTLEYLEELEERSNLETNKQARTLHKQNKQKLEKIIDELSSLQREERGMDMKKMEQRSTNEYEQVLRGQVEFRTLQTTANGGALIPENVQREIIKKMEEVSPAFSQARKFPSISGSLKVAKENDVITGGFFGEGESILEEAISFTEVSLQQKRLGSAISLSNQLINDSAVDIVAYVNDLLGRRVAKTAEKAIFNGDGVKEFVGILGDTTVKKVNLSLATSVTVDHLMDLFTSLHPDFVEGAAFYMNRTFFNKIAKLKDGNGHFYMQNGVVNGRLTYTLFGASVYVTEALQAGTTAGQVPVVFANLQQAYSILVKQEMSIRQIVDGPNALRGSQLLVLDGYMDGAVTNPQAIAKIEVTA